ncbi:FxsB family cyclophane-forming radical SAM/SPASM peptide maturase [Streptomyces sp. NPDC002677]|uniref:FxsB family cyclophane-forming radical SAM/SPASM peptide maturase n=1 Tax=Streptomyces sp. NPDC002677 TaxID=3154774 RepID=UPI003328F5EC
MEASAAVRPFQQFVVKVHSRCDLACDHCYVYRHRDQSWRDRPRCMARPTVLATAARIAEHAAAHRLKRVGVVLHGGEPLLMGRENLQWAAGELRRALDGVAALDLGMQTNGMLLDAEWCAMLARERVLTGVSLDGDRASHDRHRVRADGTGSHDTVVRAVRLLARPAYRHVFAGLLCTVDVRNDPDAVYEALAELHPPRVDLLLPHATWDHPPPRPHGTHDYADWLITVYERWNAAGRPFGIRLFESIEAAAAGENSFTEALGLGSPDLVVVETDGSIEQADWLKTVAPGAPETGFHVLTHSFDEAATHPGFQRRRPGPDSLCEQCRGCAVVGICGGGLYGHRHRSGHGFDNPSVYCADLFTLVRHVQQAEKPSRHGLTTADFETLTAIDADDTAAVRTLGAAQTSLRRSMLAGLHRAGIGSPAAWEALFALDGPALDTVLADPAVHGWAAHSWTAHARGLMPPDEGRLECIALSAAVFAGRPLELTITVGSGAVVLPSAGRLLLPASASGRSLTFATDGVRVRRADGGAARWQAMPRLEAGDLRMLLADGDFCPPYLLRPVLGMSGGAGQVPRLDTAGTAALRTRFTAAWNLLRRGHARRAHGLAAGVHTVIPLVDDMPEDVPRPPFGAVALHLSASPARLAMSLVREFQHAKFAALHDLYDLAGPGRPALRDAYLRLAVAEAARALPVPGGILAQSHGSLLSALDALAGTERSLSGPGRLLATGIRRAAHALSAPAEVHR